MSASVFINVRFIVAPAWLCLCAGLRAIWTDQVSAVRANSAEPP
jgi:hypothetical protein